MYKKYAALRDRAGITDYKIAQCTKIPRSTFSDWKAGRSRPKADKLKVLGEYFNVSIEYFLQEDNPDGS